MWFILFFEQELFSKHNRKSTKLLVVNASRIAFVVFFLNAVEIANAMLFASALVFALYIFFTIEQLSQKPLYTNMLY